MVKITIIILSLFVSSSVYSSSLVKQVGPNSKFINYSMDKSTKSKYTVEETTNILRTRKLGKIRLDHDDHVYKCTEISIKANNLEGAVDVLIASKTKLGYTLDEDEVNLLIKISKLDTELYYDIVIAAKKIGKKITSIEEHFILSKELERGNGRYLLSGIERAADSKYKIENDDFTYKKVKLLIKVGRLFDGDRLYDIYRSMRKIGLARKINTKGLEVLYKLYQIEGDVASRILEFYKKNKLEFKKNKGTDNNYMLISGYFFYSKRNLASK